MSATKVFVQIDVCAVVPTGYTVARTEGGCTGQTEICGWDDFPCSSVKTLHECANLCSRDAACISFERGPGEKTCQLSTTCTNSSKVERNDGFWLHTKSAQVLHGAFRRNFASPLAFQRLSAVVDCC